MKHVSQVYLKNVDGLSCLGVAPILDDARSSFVFDVKQVKVVIQ